MMVTANRGSKSKFKIFLKFLILVLPVALFFLIIQYNNYRDHSPLPDKALCSSCHSMQANIKTWQVTAHNQIGCSKCHDDISLTNVFFKELSGSYPKPIQKSKPIPDQQCSSCHNAGRTVTGPGDLIIPHKLHMEKQIDCTRCHSNVTHGKVAQEILAASGKNPEDLTIEEARQLTAIGNRIPMRECMVCHNNAKATDDCSACHEKKPIPASHNKDFISYSHDKEALNNMASCMSCHEYDVKKKANYSTVEKNFENQMVSARNNDFCQGCHQQRPVTHGDKFIVSHPHSVDNNQSCVVCHDKSPHQLSATPAAASVYCSTCHNNSSVHTTNWITQHPIELKTKDSNSCFECHNANSCKNCHNTRGIKR